MSEDGHRRGDRRDCADGDQRHPESSPPRLRNAIGEKQAETKAKSRARADDEPEQWGIQDEIHNASRFGDQTVSSGKPCKSYAREGLRAGS
jgi:hypothetical protein